MHKITITLPKELIEVADQQAEVAKSSRRQVIESALQVRQRQTEAQLAAEGYQFYAQEASEFARVSNKVVAMALANECSW